APVEIFERARPRLLGLTYRMLGVMSDAEDIVQEAWLRWQGEDPAGIERPDAWLTTVTTRLASTACVPRSGGENATWAPGCRSPYSSPRVPRTLPTWLNP